MLQRKTDGGRMMGEKISVWDIIEWTIGAILVIALPVIWKCLVDPV